MQDTITCPTCGGNLTRDAYSMSDPYTCDCCGHMLTLEGEHIMPLSPEQEALAEGLIKLGEEKQRIRHDSTWALQPTVTPAPQLRPTVRKPSLFARLFSRVGSKRKGWSGRRED